MLCIQGSNPGGGGGGGDGGSFPTGRFREVQPGGYGEGHKGKGDFWRFKMFWRIVSVHFVLWCLKLVAPSKVQGHNLLTTSIYKPEGLLSDQRWYLAFATQMRCRDVSNCSVAESLLCTCLITEVQHPTQIGGSQHRSCSFLTSYCRFLLTFVLFWPAILLLFWHAGTLKV